MSRKRVYYKRKILGNAVRIPYPDYIQLLKRFDPKRATSRGTSWHIEEVCPLCNHDPRKPMCSGGCPFRAIQPYACMNFIRSLVGKKTTEFLGIGPSDVSWKYEDDKEARRRLRRIQEELKKFKRVVA